MDAQNNLLNYYINYDVRKDRDYLTSNKVESGAKYRGLTLSRVVDNLNQTSAKRAHERSLTPANSFDLASVLNQPENENPAPKGDENHVAHNTTTAEAESSTNIDPNLNLTVNKTTTQDGLKNNDEKDEISCSSDAGSHGLSISTDNRQRRAYRFNARPQLYDVVSKQRQFDRLYRLTDYDSDQVKARRENFKTVLTQICQGEDNLRGSLDRIDLKDADGNSGANDDEVMEAELPVYLQLLAMQPALVPISMLLPPGGWIENAVA